MNDHNRHQEVYDMNHVCMSTVGSYRERPVLVCKKTIIQELQFKLTKTMCVGLCGLKFELHFYMQHSCALSSSSILQNL